MLGKKLMENILVFLIAGVVALIGFAMLFYEFIAEDYRTVILSDKGIARYEYEREENLKKDDPNYSPFNTTKTVTETQYARKAVVEIEGELVEIEMKSAFKFLIPGQGSTITVRKDYDGAYKWEHPIRNILVACLWGFGGLGFFVFTYRSCVEEVKEEKKKNSGKRKGKGRKK